MDKDEKTTRVGESIDVYIGYTTAAQRDTV